MVKKAFLLLFSIVSLKMHAQTYITNVTVADVEKHQLIPNQTVVITGDIISDVQPGKRIKIPVSAITIDGTGKYLMPGLTDAHIHFFQNGGLYTRPDAIDLRKYMPYEKEIQLAKDDMERKLRLYLKNGITTLIDVGANYHYLKQREDYRNNDSLPSIFITGPLATTYEPAVYQNLKDDEPFNLVKTVEDGIKMVQNQLPYKPDFIKIWYIAGADGLPAEASARRNLPIIKAIIDEAHKNNLKVAVHATERITAQLSVENGADLLVHSIDNEIISQDFVQLLKKNNIVLCPTLIVHGNYEKTFAQAPDLNLYELETADAHQLGTLLDLRHLPDTNLVNRYKRFSSSQQAVERLKKGDSIRMVNLKILSDAGVLIATGTDAGNIGTLHASSYLAELQAMQKSGMSNWQILTASTINGAKFVSRENEFGTVSKGKKANLVLLDANPIDDIRNVTRINRVINRGVIIDPKELLVDTPEDLAQRQLNAYNLRNIEAFLEPYADDVEVYMYPNTLQFKGKETMRKNYSGMFAGIPNLHCELVGRIVQGNIVIDKERVRFGPQVVEAVAIYHVEKGKISKVYFIQ